MFGTLVTTIGDGRQVSQGTVWTVGGMAPSPSTIDDGQGHLFRSGTNARVFSTSFSSLRPSAVEELERYQGRVASALSMDIVRKVLDFDGHGTFPRCAAKKLSSAMSQRTAWTGSEWCSPTSSPSEAFLQIIGDVC